MSVQFDNADQAIAATDKLVDAVCKLWRVPRGKLLARNRSGNVALARQVCFWACREVLDLSYPNIGRLFDRDHADVMHGRRVINHARETLPKFCARTDQLRAQLEAGR